MLNLVTGLPGNGKTLYTLWMVDRISKAEGRPVFYHGIDLTERGREVLGWQRLEDPRRWFTLPPLSIVVIDEAQKVFEPMPAGSKPPQFISELETHRHTGIDLFLLTQHPQMIHTHVRKLAGRHYFLLRKFGGSSTNVYQFESCEDVPKKALSQGMRTTWKLATSYYPLYKSAEVHTVKADFPLRYIAMVGGAAVLVLGGLGYVYYHFSHGAGVEGAVGTSSHAVASPQSPAVATPERQRRPNPWNAELRTPRIAEALDSAPFYDGLSQRPVSAPRVYGCGSLGPNNCTCHTWQGSRIPMSVHTCKRLMRDGWFDPYKPQPGGGERGARPQAANPVPISPASSPQSGVSPAF